MQNTQYWQKRMKSSNLIRFYHQKTIPSWKQSRENTIVYKLVVHYDSEVELDINQLSIYKLLVQWSILWIVLGRRKFAIVYPFFINSVKQYSNNFSYWLLQLLFQFIFPDYFPILYITSFGTLAEFLKNTKSNIIRHTNKKIQKTVT